MQSHSPLSTAVRSKTARRLFHGLQRSLIWVLICSVLFSLAPTPDLMAQSQSSGSDAGKTVYLPAVVSQSNTVSDLVPQTPDQYNATSTQAPNAQVGAATFCSSYIYFNNQSSYTVKIYWVDSWGNEVLYYTLSSQQAYWQQSYYGHKWRIRSTSGTLLKEALTSSCFNMTVNIYNSDFPPTPTPVPPTPTNTSVPPTPTPGGCVPCAKGVTNMTLQLTFRVSTGDRNERIRVRADSLTGQVLYDTWNDSYTSDSGLPVGASFSFNVPAAATQVVVTVQGANHPSETIKATFSAECNLVIGTSDGNSYTSHGHNL